MEADSKRYARVKVLETVCDMIETGMRERGFEPPPALEEVLSSNLSCVGRVPALGAEGWHCRSRP